ncbi:hypothetical protein AB835_11865 [Candidatus Endobugula sertula]|uniref:FAD-binding domain-containing protein n=1 Tax=Candidatus Endobugula sertula TaxID=62101 RepID=A0A1D2QMQ5_9GAMM|nr:hypothetical protein AB835_11865 [Candidatus Endobugula sertula]
MTYTVIGGGIAGTAIAMLIARHKPVTVIDRLTEKMIRSSGAGFVLWPNGVKIIRSLFPEWKEGDIGTALTAVDTYKRTGELLSTKDLQATLEQSGYYPMVVNRAVLMGKLYDYIEQSHLPVNYVFSKDMDYQALLNQESDASVFLCSGINTEEQRYVEMPFYAGVYNFIGVSETFLPHASIGQEYLGDQVRAGYMPLPNNQLYFRYSLFLPSKTRFIDPKKILQEKFSTFPACVREHIDSLYNQNISVRPEMSVAAVPLMSCINRNYPVLGDALCPMTSGSGQGVSQALEDACLFYLLWNEYGLTPMMLRNYYNERLERREVIREAYLKVTQMMSLSEEDFINTWAEQALCKSSTLNNPILILPAKISEAIKCGTISFS